MRTPLSQVALSFRQVVIHYIRRFHVKIFYNLAPIMRLKPMARSIKSIRIRNHLIKNVILPKLYIDVSLEATMLHLHYDHTLPFELNQISLKDFSI
jgi:hypothetical protein